MEGARGRMLMPGVGSDPCVGNGSWEVPDLTAPGSASGAVARPGAAASPSERSEQPQTARTRCGASES